MGAAWSRMSGTCLGALGLAKFDDTFEDQLRWRGAVDDDRLAVDELLQNPTGTGASYPVEIDIELTELPATRDQFTKTAAFVVAEVVDVTADPVDPSHDTRGRLPDNAYSNLYNAHPRKIAGRTETVIGSPRPAFIQAVVVKLLRQHDLQLYFTVYHESAPGRRIAAQTALAYTTVSLAELVQRKRVGMLKLTSLRPGNRRGFGFMHLSAERIANVQEEVTMQLEARGLARWNRAPPNAFLVFNRVQGHKMTNVAKTNTVAATCHPKWKELRVKGYRLCLNDDFLPIQVVGYSADVKGGGVHYIGSARTNLATLLSGTISSLTLVNEARVGDRRYTGSGEILFQRVTRKAPHNFSDYLNAGMDALCVLACDMSLSNQLAGGAPRDQHNATNSDYALAMKWIADSFHRFTDSDHTMSAYLYGAWPRMWPALDRRGSAAGSGAHPCPLVPLLFDKKGCARGPLDGDDAIEDPRALVAGADGVVRGYFHAIKHVTMLETRRLAPVLRDLASQCDTVTHDRPYGTPPYRIVVVFTNGVVDDMTEAMDVVVESSQLPVSFLVVGIGKGRSSEQQQQQPHARDPPAGGGGPAGDDAASPWAALKRMQDPHLRSLITGKSVVREICSVVVFNETRADGQRSFARAALQRVSQQFAEWVALSGLDIADLPEFPNLAARRGTRSIVASGRKGFLTTAAANSNNNNSTSARRGSVPAFMAAAVERRRKSDSPKSPRSPDRRVPLKHSDVVEVVSDYEPTPPESPDGRHAPPRATRLNGLLRSGPTEHTRDTAAHPARPDTATSATPDQSDDHGLGRTLPMRNPRSLPLEARGAAGGGAAARRVCLRLDSDLADGGGGGGGASARSGSILKEPRVPGHTTPRTAAAAVPGRPASSSGGSVPVVLPGADGAREAVKEIAVPTSASFSFEGGGGGDATTPPPARLNGFHAVDDPRARALLDDSWEGAGGGTMEPQPSRDVHAGGASVDSGAGLFHLHSGRSGDTAVSIPTTRVASQGAPSRHGSAAVHDGSATAAAAAIITSVVSSGTDSEAGAGAAAPPPPPLRGPVERDGCRRRSSTGTASTEATAPAAAPQRASFTPSSSSMQRIRRRLHSMQVGQPRTASGTVLKEPGAGAASGAPAPAPALSPPQLMQSSVAGRVPRVAAAPAPPPQDPLRYLDTSPVFDPSAVGGGGDAPNFRAPPLPLLVHGDGDGGGDGAAGVVAARGSPLRVRPGVPAPFGRGRTLGSLVREKAIPKPS